MRRSGSTRLAVLVLVCLAGLLLAACSRSGTPAPAAPLPAPDPTGSATAKASGTPSTPGSEATAPDKPARPNIVLVLMDDFSDDLVPALGVADTMAAQGASYPNSFVVDSLCCVSRSALFTGQYPEQNGVRSNSSRPRDGAGPIGGWPAFTSHGNPDRAFNMPLHRAGWTTGFVGKYLNEYEYNPGWPLPPELPGWSQFHVVFGSAYDGWGFDSTSLVNGRLQTTHHPTPARDASEKVRDASYAGQVIEDYAMDFIRAQRGSEKPYFLEVAPYAPHSRTDAQGAWPGEPFFPAAFRDRPTEEHPGNCGPVRCPSLNARSLPGFGDDPADNRPITDQGRPARAWNVDLPQAPARAYAAMRQQRAQMVQSVNRTVRRILSEVDDNTYVFLTSDNGFHLGQNGLGEGKGTAYDTDVRVPLWVIGPGVTPGERSEWTTNIDLATTFEDLAGLTPAPFRSGRSLVPSLDDPAVRNRRYVYFEHTNEPALEGDPDRVRNGYEIDRIPSYVAVRGDEGLLIRNDLSTGAGETETGYEYYPYDQVSWERTNEFAEPRYADQVRTLMARLTEFDGCRELHGTDPVPKRCRG